MAVGIDAFRKLINFYLFFVTIVGVHNSLLRALVDKPDRFNVVAVNNSLIFELLSKNYRRVYDGSYRNQPDYRSRGRRH